ncbi:MAG: hypothetical protein B6D56_08470 [Candidatus Omnitrophica bacterium 4484_70.1]|nr:MAG: hypothetical protein B6D56_08470 [Candidatus Omnitrophica bacterium 4484_70.1]
MRKLFLFFISLFSFFVFAQELTIVYTGNTFASLYPCGEYLQGGITRRATILKELREKERNIVVIEAGGFSAGSFFDEFSLNEDLDKKRTVFYLKALKKLDYDVIGLAEADFALGEEFLKKIIRKSSLDFVSTNLRLKGTHPFLIRKVDKIKIGILCLVYTSSFNWERTEKILKRYLHLLERKKVNFVILLSNLRDDLNVQIAKQFGKKINLIISTGFGIHKIFFKKIDGVIVAKPTYQGKSIRMIKFKFDREGKIIDSKFKEIKLSYEIAEDKKIKRIIPACFSDKDCYLLLKKPAKCKNKATLKAFCEEKFFKVEVITDKKCSFCTPQITEEFLKKFYSGWNFSYLDYKEKRAKVLIKKYKIKTLPAFIFPSDIEKEIFFPRISTFFKKREDKYLLKEEISGINIFLERGFIKKRIDLFFHLTDKNLLPLLKMIKKISQEKGYSLYLHFILKDKEKEFIQEETERLIAIKFLYPSKFFSYFFKRLENINSSWWVNLIEEEGMSLERIKKFIENKKVKDYLEKEKKLRKELGINRGIAILVNNCALFQLINPSYSDLEKLLEYAKKLERGKNG